MEATLINWLWLILLGVSGYLITKSFDHEKRIQRVEDVQGSKIDTQGMKIDLLAQELKEYKIEISQKLETLTAMVHKDKNFEQQLNTTLSLLLDKLNKEDK